MEVIGRVGVQAAQFQVLIGERCPALGHICKDDRVCTVAGGTGQLVTVLHVQRLFFCVPSTVMGEINTVEGKLHFCFHIVGAP